MIEVSRPVKCVEKSCLLFYMVFGFFSMHSIMLGFHR